MKIRAIIIDDEINNVENLQNLLSIYCTDILVVGCALNAVNGKALIESHKPELIFLDIQMPIQSGFDLLKSFSQIDFEIIFITAFDQYGIQAIKFSALDYLLKPIDIEELKIAVHKAEKRISERQNKDKIENLIEYIKNSYKGSPKIALPTLNETIYVSTDEIVRCEASDNYTTFFLQNKEKILVCKTLKEYSDLLKPYNFIRTHQSHLVNALFVKSMLKEDGGALLMKDQKKIPISRQNKEAVKTQLKSL